MSDLKCDFGSLDDATLYPSHGWAYNSQALRLLWLPVLRAFKQASELRQSRGLEPLDRIQEAEVYAFRHTLEKLILSLRELHKTVQFIASCGGFDGPQRDEYYAVNLIPVYIDSVYMYVRRLADRFANAARFILFAHPGSAPRKYKMLRAMWHSNVQYQRLGCLHDAKLLESVFFQNSAWFDLVRDPDSNDGIQRKGLRDTLEHRPVVVTVALGQSGEEPWEVGAFMRAPDSQHVDILTPINLIISDLCKMLTCFVRVIDPNGSYKVRFNGDTMFVTGKDEDSTGYWPALELSANTSDLKVTKNVTLPSA